VFARTLAKTSRLYWTQENNGNWTGWSLIGGTSVALTTDMTVVYNGFSKVTAYNKFSFGSDISVSEFQM
jgi:hypothetical protein